MALWRPGDVADVSEYANDEEFSRYLLGVPFPYSIEHAEQFVAACVAARWDTDPRLAVVIDGRVAGSVDIRIDPGKRTAEIGFSISRPHWGAGYMTEAVSAVVAWAFRARELAKMWATTDVDNVAAIRVLEKVGMAREGVLRGHHPGRHGVGRVDVAQYGLLRSEWRPGGQAK